MAWFAALQVYSATSSVDVIVTLYCDRVMTRDFTQSAPDRGWEILLLPPRACTNIMTGTNHLLGRAHGGKYSLELKLLHRVLIWDD